MSYHDNRSSVSGGGGGDIDRSMDPSAGGLFTVDFRKHEDLKNMLDSNKDGLKLDAMKRIIGMVAKGRNASHLFPAVVKNVACKNIEVKKLVYVYLERYAEEQQDLALLSISTFQRGLKDPNQLIRASALRVLSSIRVSIIVPIMMMAIKESVNDMSPFVRKTAAHAIPKLYSLDPEQKENLIEVLDKLLNDRTTLVAGSVVMAYQDLCPERIDLVHKHYRKLCNLLVDVDEWGQIAILNMLTRYARTQFTNPNKFDDVGDEADKPFYEDEDSEKEEVVEDKPKYIMDADHRLLLKCAKPLLQSRNAAVVMTVAQLFYHVAPRREVNVVAKGLVRLLRSYREVQAIVLQNIASMSLTSKSAFSPFLKSFYVRSTDPTHVRILKLEVLTNLASETSISTILREFQTYVRSSDKQFVAHTIQAIGRCAANITEVTDTCLNGLVGLLSNRDETVVAESIIVIKKLLQMNPSHHKDIIKHMGKLFITVQVPMAKASILWLIGEYSEHVQMIAPDVLRQAAKNFINEDDVVKLQIVNLASKLYVINQKQTKLLTQYVLQLAKYDQNYDIRDRARFLRHLIMPSGDNGGTLHKHAKKILLASKPAPVLESPFKDRERYQLGTLSHCLNTEASGYQKLPDFPETQPDPSVRNVEIPEWEKPTKARHTKKTVKSKKSFYSDEESSESDAESGSESDSESGTEDSDSDSSSSASTEGPDSRVSDSDKLPDTPVVKKVQRKQRLSSSEERSSATDSSDSDSSSSGSGSESSSEDSSPPPPKAKASPKKKQQKTEISLLDLEDFDLPSVAPVVAPSKVPGGILAPTLTTDLQGLYVNDASDFSSMGSNPYFDGGTKHELLHRVTGNGLSATYRYTRSPCIYGDKMITIELEMYNHSDEPVTGIHMGEKKLQGGLKVQDFSKIDVLQPAASISTTFGVDFCDTTQPLVFDLCTSNRQFNVSIKVPVGELMHAVVMAEEEFVKQQKKMSGMNENMGKVLMKTEEARTDRAVCKSVVSIANVGRVPSIIDNMYRFAGKTASTHQLVLIEVDLSAASDSVPAKLKVNCEKMVIGSLILKKIKEACS